MSDSGKYHAHSVLIGRTDDLFVPNRTSGLNHGGYSRLRRFINTVPEGENASDAITAPRKLRPA